MGVAWSDLNQDGKRCEKIIKFCMTRAMNEKNDDVMCLAYIDRLLKATHQKTLIVETVLNVRKALQDVKYLTKAQLV